MLSRLMIQDVIGIHVAVKVVTYKLELHMVICRRG